MASYPPRAGCMVKQEPGSTPTGTGLQTPFVKMEINEKLGQIDTLGYMNFTKVTLLPEHPLLIFPLNGHLEVKYLRAKFTVAACFFLKRASGGVRIFSFEVTPLPSLSRYFLQACESEGSGVTSKEKILTPPLARLRKKQAATVNFALKYLTSKCPFNGKISTTSFLMLA
ncbi:hypothetical protein Fcan01_21724 [Folsomia candida]|uniref:Uncharacterized protein n=1 Tax=Folsomia candida TaxID=158441 RepID=A0A226DE67_FOLCA|nr:hypothetical protein Fcan01_21724 [Folsomia candida]